MAGISVGNQKILSLFPLLDRDSSLLFLHILKGRKKSGITLIVSFMEDCNFLELWGKYSLEDINLFFEKKTEVLRGLTFGNEKQSVFNSIKKSGLKIEWDISREFFEEVV